MAGIIKISDTRFDGYISRLTFDLADLLHVIEPYGSQLTWSVIGEVDILRNNKGFPTGIKQKLNKKINLTPGGITLSWQELDHFSKYIVQTSTAVFAGYHGKQILSTENYKAGPILINTDNELYNKCEIVLEVWEGTFWLLSSKNNDLLNHLQQIFKNVTVIQKW